MYTTVNRFCILSLNALDVFTTKSLCLLNDYQENTQVAAIVRPTECVKQLSILNFFVSSNAFRISLWCMKSSIQISRDLDYVLFV